MLEYLVKNKEWIFSGVGVFLLAAVIGIIKFFWNRKKIKELKRENFTREKDSFEKAKVNALKDVVEPSNVTVKTIIDEINNAPPFQRDTVSDNYKGIKVRWEGRLWNVEKVDFTNKSRQLVKVEFHPIPGNLHYRVLLQANIDEYPELRVAKRDSMIAAEGKIIRCSGKGMYVEIEPSKLIFPNS